MAAPSSRTARQRGIALLGAILLAAIVTALAIGIGQRGGFTIAATTRVIESTRADEVFLALEDAARQALYADTIDSDIDSADEAWAADTLVVQDGAGRGRLADLQGRFNLNNLAPSAVAARPADAAAGTPDAAATAPGAAPATNTGEAAPRARATLPGGPPPADPGMDAPATDHAPQEADTTRPVFDASTLSVSERRRQLAMLPAPYVPQDGAAGASAAAGAAAQPRGAAAGEATGVTAASGAPANGAASRSAGPAEQALAAVPAVAALRAGRTVDATDAVTAGATAADAGRAGATAPRLSEWEVAVARFALLLAALDVDDDIIPAILDWLDADSDTRFPHGAEDDYYMDRDDPYRAANRPFADLSELRLVRSVTPEIYARVAPFLCVLPMPSDINVNMAPPEILMALGPAIDRGTADLLVEARTAQPFRNVDEMLDFPLLAGRPLLPGGLATTTTWFALDMHARIGDSALSARALLARSAPDRIEVLNRQRSFVDE